MQNLRLAGRFTARTAIVIALVLVASVGVLLGIGVQAARSDNGTKPFCSNVLLAHGGQGNLYDTCINDVSHNLTRLEADGISNAAPCVGGTYHNYQADFIKQPGCTETEGGAAFQNLLGALAYPAVHNHSTHQGRFQGYY